MMQQAYTLVGYYYSVRQLCDDNKNFRGELRQATAVRTLVVRTVSVQLDTVL
jgi:hypothetical protein